MKGNTVKRIAVTGLIAAAVLNIVWAAAAWTTPAAPAEITIDNFTFGPQAMKVPAGTTVTWTNRDDIPHTVVSTDKVFKSRVLDTDEKYSFTFAAPGTYTYFCSIHPKMTGKVVVQ
jgi:amicyanin